MEMDGRMSFDFKFDLVTVENPEKDHCIGLIFRGYRNFYMQGGKIELKQGIRLLKRKSCPGCNDCEYLLEDANESISCGSLIFPEIEDGAEYSVRNTNIRTDWESGMVDSWDTEVYKL